MFDKMIVDLERIKTILKNSQATGKIPDIERDIMLSKLRIIYEFILLYQPEFMESKTLLKEERTTDTLKPPKTEPLQNIPEQETIPIIKQTPNPEPVIKTEPKPTVEKPIKPIIPDTSVTILAEKLQMERSFLHDVLAQYSNTFDIAKKFQNSPISNIFTAIGINEKFLFIKELFNENAELFHSTIEKLNQANSFNEAIEYIDKNFTWNFESSTVHKLLELVRRRHPNMPE